MMAVMTPFFAGKKRTSLIDISEMSTALQRSFLLRIRPMKGKESMFGAAMIMLDRIVALW